MICDACLMRLKTQMNDETRKVLYGYRNADNPTHEALAARTGLSQYHLREAMMHLRGTGLIWGRHFYSISSNGRRLIKLLATADQPEPSERLCDDCLLEIANMLPNKRDAYSILDQLMLHHYRTTPDLTAALGISIYKLREISFMLEAVQLIGCDRGHVYYLRQTGRRLAQLLEKGQVSHQPALALT